MALRQLRGGWDLPSPLSSPVARLGLGSFALTKPGEIFYASAGASAKFPVKAKQLALTLAISPAGEISLRRSNPSADKAVCLLHLLAHFVRCAVDGI